MGANLAPLTAKAEAFASAIEGDDVAGIYLVGSAALGDWQERVSNLDVVVVGEVDERLRTAIPSAVALLATPAGPARVALVPTAALGAAPPGVGTQEWCGPDAVGVGELANPFTWQVLAADAVTIVGEEYLPVATDTAAVQEWAASRLAERWVPWVQTAGRVPGQLWRRRPLAEALLEVVRLYVAATRGEVVAKARAASLVMEVLPVSHHRVVKDALGYRQGSSMSMYWGWLERKRHSVELMSALAGGELPAPGAER